MFIIGTVLIGVVDQLNEQAICTRFVTVGVPLFPEASVYVTRASGRWNRAGSLGFDIPLDKRSVFAAYMRMLLPLAAVWAYYTGKTPIAVACAALFAYMWFLFGKLPKDEVARRELLCVGTGLFADPAILPAEVATDVIKRLETRLLSMELPIDHAAWQVRPAQADHRGTVYALARYRGWSDVARREDAASAAHDP